MVEAIGFKQFFPQANLCTWHTNETFKKKFKKAEQKTILKQMIDTKSKEEFYQLKNQLYSISSAEQITYFDNNWLNITHKWTTFERKNMVLFG